MFFSKTKFIPIVLCAFAVFFCAAVDARAATTSISIGKTVNLSVTANGTAPFTYKWYKDSAAISGATSSTYSIGSMQTANAGTYYAIVTNSVGSTTSDQATLVLVSSITFSTQPASKTVIAGGSVTFTASAAGVPTPTYQWKKNGTAISGATNSSYTISNVTTANAGTYTVTASNSSGSATSNGAVLTVTSGAVAPAFTTQPTSKTVSAGSPVTFSAAASGSPTPTYQWKKNGTSISGATNSSYTISSVSTSSAGTYTVVAANSAGTKTSNGAVLTVTSGAVAPAFTTQPVSKTVSPGSPVTFSAAASGSPTPTYQWKKNGTSISGATSSSYTISSVSTSSAGTYTIVATNSAGTKTSNGAVLTVQASGSSVSIWSTSAVPRVVDSGADSPVELGVKFRSDVAGKITGVRFYKAAGNTGVHIGNLWSSSGTLLATGIFSAESGSGWQQVAFPSPVTISANSTYVVSYHCNNGHYSADANYFTSAGVNNPPLHALPGGRSGSNGVYAYGSSSQFPRQSYNSCNYWVDAMFQPQSASAMALDAGLDSSTASMTAVAPMESQILSTGTDFNGDGQADLVWQNTVTGQCVVWIMNGTKVINKTSIGTFSLEWQLVGTGDYDTDGKSDLLWQNSATGEASVWLMSGTTVVSKVSLGKIAPDWKIRGVGSFSDTGHFDIILQNAVTGEGSIWSMSGSSVSSKVSIGTAALEWEICGAGDFNGDRSDDILWQNILTGERSIWLMDGTKVVSKVSLGTSSPDLEIGGGEDLDGDGQTDIIWQNIATGASSVWLMSGTERRSIVPLETQPPAWIVGN